MDRSLLRLAALGACSILATAGCDGGAGSPVPDAGDTRDPITVTGKVVDGSGYPIAGVTAFILGAAPVTTDAAGEFVIDGVEPPYDLLLVSIADANAALFVGLTRPDPELEASFAQPGAYSATLEGSLVAGVGSEFATPNPPSTRTHVAMNGSRGGGAVSRGPGEASSPYSLDSFWTLTPTVSGTVHALQWVEAAPDVASDFVAYGYTSVSGVEDGETQNVPSITMNAVNSGEISGSVEVLGDFELSAVATGVVLADDQMFQPSSEEVAGTTFDHVLPVLAGAEAYVFAQAFSPGSMMSGVMAVRTGLAVPATDVVVTIPDVELPTPVAPGAGVGGFGGGSELVWTEVAGALYLVQIGPTVLEPGLPEIVIYTTNARVEVPDLAPYGVLLPPATSYTWAVRAVDGFESVDEVAEPGVLASVNAFRRDIVIAVGPESTVVTE